MMFSQLLKDAEKQSSLARKSLIAQLQLFHLELSNLDEITFSRWVNGATKPSFYKQLIVASFFTDMFRDFYFSTEAPLISKKNKETFSTAMNNLDNSYHRVSYNPLPKAEISIFAYELDYKEHNEKLGNFYANMKTYDNLHKDLKNAIPTPKIYLLTLEFHQQIISHTSCIFNMKQLTPYLDGFDMIPTANSILFNVSYFYCRSYFKLLNGILLNHILNQNVLVEEIYIASRGELFIETLAMFGGDVIWTSAETSTIGNINITKFDTLSFLSNPIVVKIIKDTELIYKNLKENAYQFNALSKCVI